MNNFFLVMVLLLIDFNFCMLNCFSQESNKFSEVKKLEDFPNTEFLPTLEHTFNKNKNCIYSASLIYSWQEIKKNVGEPIIDTNFKELTLLNESKFHLNLLKPNEYSSTINIKNEQIIVKSEFSKNLDFTVKLNDYKGNLIFDETKVSSFGVSGFDSNMKKEFEILYYKDDYNFVIKLKPKDIDHEILLFKFKSEPSNSLSEIITMMNANIELGKKEIKNKDNLWRFHLKKGDELIIPKFKFNIEFDYKSFSGSNFKANDTNYVISKVSQKNSFLLDHNGATVESKAELEVSIKSQPEDSETKKMIKFDKPFLLILKRADNVNPYFAMWVANTELMERE